MANLISKITQEHKLLSDISLKHIIYLFLISDTRKSGRTTDIFSVYEVINVVDKFSTFEELEVENCLNLLENEGLIVIVDDSFLVGTYVDNNYKLFNGTKDNPAEFFNSLDDSYQEFRKNMRNSNKRFLVENIGSKIDKLKNKDVTAWVRADFMDLFQVTYESVFQEFIKEFQRKEEGQMKLLVKVYDNATVIKMIIYYIHNSDSIHRNLPTIGLLLYHKDTVYSKIATKQKQNTKRHERDDSDF